MQNNHKKIKYFDFRRPGLNGKADGFLINCNALDTLSLSDEAS